MLCRIASVPLILSLVLLLFPNVADSQNKEMPVLEVGGKVRLDEGEMNDATIEVYNTDSNEIEQQLAVTETGKFDFQLPFQHKYRLIFKNDGSYPKALILNTIIPEKVLKRDPYFPPIKIIVTLFKVVPEIDPSFSEKAVGKIFYSAKVDNFDSESYFNDMQIRQKIDEEVAVSYQEKLAVAKTYEEAGNLNEAVAEYQKAANLKQGDDSVPEKIASLKEQIKQEEQVKQAQAARKDRMDKQLIAASLETADTADNTLEIQANQSASVQKTSEVTVTNEKQNLAEQTRPDSAEITAQTAEVEPEKVLQDSARKETTETEKHEAVATTETTEIQKTEQEKAEPLSVDSEDKGSMQASIQPHENDSGSGILLISGLILFALLILLWIRRKAKQKDTMENK